MRRRQQATNMPPCTQVAPFLDKALAPLREKRQAISTLLSFIFFLSTYEVDMVSCNWLIIIFILRLPAVGHVRWWLPADKRISSPEMQQLPLASPPPVHLVERGTYLACCAFHDSVEQGSTRQTERPGSFCLARGRSLGRREQSDVLRPVDA